MLLLPLVLGPHWGSPPECVKVKGALGVARTVRKQMGTERERNKREINREEKDVPTCSFPLHPACGHASVLSMTKP